LLAAGLDVVLAEFVVLARFFVRRVISRRGKIQSRSTEASGACG